MGADQDPGARRKAIEPVPHQMSQPPEHGISGHSTAHCPAHDEAGPGRQLAFGWPTGEQVDHDQAATRPDTTSGHCLVIATQSHSVAGRQHPNPLP